MIGQSTYSVTTGQSVTLVCSVSAIPAVSTITWKISDTGGHMNTLNVNGVKYTGGTTGIPSLTIVTTAKSDQRYYMCSATNSIGTGDSQMTYLYVTGGRYDAGRQSYHHRQIVYLLVRHLLFRHLLLKSLRIGIRLSLVHDGHGIPGSLK